MWKKKQNTDGVRDVFQRQNKKLCLCQRFLLTKEDGSTNAHNVDKHHGCKEEDRQLNLSTKIAIKILNFCWKIVYTISSFSVIFLSVTIEKQVKCKTLQWQ